MSQPSVSRIISKLEADLGGALFVRSTRSMQLTEAGLDYLARIEPVLAMLDEANHLVRGDGQLRGHLRIGATTSFATREVIPRLSAFQAVHPDLKIDLVMTDSLQNLIEESIDVVLRFGKLKDSTMTAKKLLVSPRLVAASPLYLEMAGTPETPASLANHKIIISPSSESAIAWTFQKDGKRTSVKTESSLRVTVNEGATAAALSGLGIISTSMIGCRKDIKSGALVRILPDWEIGFVEVHAILAGGRNAKASSRAFVDYLAQSMHADHRRYTR